MNVADLSKEVFEALESDWLSCGPRSLVDQFTSSCRQLAEMGMTPWRTFLMGL